MTAEQATATRTSSPWSMDLRGWKSVIAKSFSESSSDNIGLVAAGVAFYAFLSLVPLLGVLVLTYGFVADPHTVVKNMEALTRVLPADAAKLIGQQLLAVVNTSGGTKGVGIVVALAIALFGARNAAGSLIIALNIAYEEEERRGFIKVTALALLITVVGIVVALLAMLGFSVLAFLETLLPHSSRLVREVMRLMSYVLLLGGATAAAATLYRYAPSHKEARWTWITPGSLFSAIGWLVLTLGFGVYVARFGAYGRNYGSLASVVVLLTWAYLSSYVFLFGAELNSEFEKRNRPDTKAGAVAPEARPSTLPAIRAASPEPRPVDEGDHPLLASRLAARTARSAGFPRVGLAASVLATAGLSLLQRRGRAAAGAALLGTAGLLAWRRRER